MIRYLQTLMQLQIIKYLQINILATIESGAKYLRESIIQRRIHGIANTASTIRKLGTGRLKSAIIAWKDLAMTICEQ